MAVLAFRALLGRRQLLQCHVWVLGRIVADMAVWQAATGRWQGVKLMGMHRSPCGVSTQENIKVMRMPAWEYIKACNETSMDNELHCHNSE